MISSAFCEALSIASLLPFLSILTNPNNLEDITFFNYISNLFNLKDSNSFLFPLTIIFCFAILSSGMIRILNLYLSNKLSALIGSDLSINCYRNTLYQPYQIHLKRNTSKIISTITEYISGTINSLNAFLQLITALVVASSLILTLFLINIKIAFTIIFIVGAFYFLIVVLIRKKLKVNSLITSNASKEQIKAIQEGLGAIRDVLISGSQLFYLNVFEKYDKRKRLKQGESNFYAASPKFALESIGIVFITMIAFQYTQEASGNISIIPFLGALALGAQKLLPACQQIFLNWSTIKSYNYQIEGVLNLLKQPVEIIPKRKYIGKVFLSKELELKNICFCYIESSNFKLSNINLTIRKGERIGIIGETGSGKSTLLDIMMGLIKPDSGQFFIDGIDLIKNNKLDHWRSTISHVPQNIYLSDTTIEENIALGINSKNIDFVLLKECAKKAQIHNFINTLPKKYKTIVGERGVQLSGGQKQRIGIARALYKKSKVLFLDEATSALDNKTEKEFLKAIDNLSKEITLVIVAHRLTTIEKCNKVIELNKGKVIQHKVE